MGRIPAFCCVLREDDEGDVHVERAFEIGTAKSQLLSGSKRKVRAIWENVRDLRGGRRFPFIVDNRVADGLDTPTIKIEQYPDDLPGNTSFLYNVDHLDLPSSLPNAALREHVTVTIPEKELYYGCREQRPPPAQPKDVDLYRVLYKVNGARAQDLMS